MRLECNGQSFDRNRFPQLYETLGKTTVPYSVGSTGGEDFHTLTEDEMPSHMHNYGWIEYTNTLPDYGVEDTSSYDLETFEHSFG